ncbi:Zn-ribbon domain-containing OB-fold protein [Streptomyces sp. NPDC020792]|uniref:Zn-ribbon domain-containing OB-fold protein n=1 Tax=Streptomyces sp. NPDC020792 TaxID=3365089 RepID=UPI00378FE950
MTESPAPPLQPVPDDMTSFFWDAARRHELHLQHCSSCGTYQHPPEPVCSSCLSFDLGGAPVSGRGTVYSYEMATQAFHPAFADKLPLCIAVIELDDQPGLKILSNIIDLPADGVSVGDRVEVCFNDLSDTIALPVFRLARA